MRCYLSLIRSPHSSRIREDPEFKQFLEAIERSKQKLNIEIRTEGHTDNLPLPKELTSKWKSNWELSTARALNVVELLSEFSELSEDKFSAMGYGEFRPVGKNDTPEGRARNRRVEIYLDAFVTMEEVITVSPFPAP